MHARAPVGRWYSRRIRFTERQRQAVARDGETCPISGLPLVTIVAGRRHYFRHVDHLWSEKFCRSYIKGSDPHILENLLCIHPSVHGRKTAAERYLYAGNLLSFKQEVIRIGFDWTVFERALTALNKSASGKKGKIASTSTSI